MSTQLYVTDRVNALLDTKVAELKARTKEGFVNAILLLALTDRDFLIRALELQKHLFEGAGVTTLEEEGL